MQGKMDAYMQFLEQEERSLATRKQYRRDILHFCAFLGEEPPSKERVIQYKQALQQRYQPSSVNAKLAAVNGFLSFLELPQLRVKQLKIQRSPFLPGSKELNRAEYAQLVKTARLTGDERLAMLLQTICSTGIRVSELPFITAEAALAGAASIHLKGKHRTILLPEQLCRALQDYLARRGITSGPIFVTRSGRPLDRSNIWREMRALCAQAGVEAKRVFPHNFRHLFARAFYALEKDIAKLADLLGHASVETTRIYIMESGAEHRRQVERLGLVV